MIVFAIIGALALAGGIAAVVLLPSRPRVKTDDIDAMKEKWAREDGEKEQARSEPPPQASRVEEVLTNQNAKAKPPAVAAAITEAQVVRIYEAQKSEIALVSPDGEPRRFFAKKQQGPQTYTVSLVSMNGDVLASIPTMAESDSGVIGARHYVPVAAVGVVENSLVFVGGDEKITGKGAYTLDARVFRWNDAEAIVQVQKLKIGFVASASGDDKPPQRIPDQPVQPLHQRSSNCKVDRALVGLDKASVVCIVDNSNSRSFMVHVVGSLVSDNFAPHTGELDVVVPAYESKDSRIEFKDVDAGRSQNLRCVCNVTSPDVAVR